MPIPKHIANKVLTNLDSAAQKLESLVKSGKADPRVASIIRDIDSFADRFQVASFGPDNLRAHQAKVLKRDSEEVYMDTFNNPVKVIHGDDDESFMHSTPASFNSKAIPNFDADRSSTVTDRNEYDVRGLNEWADGTKKQPSWARGSAGKSTRQGSTVEKRWAEDSGRKASSEKRWAD